MIKHKCLQFSSKPKFELKRLLWIGNTSTQLKEQGKRSINDWLNSVKLWVILKSDVLFPPNFRDNVTVFQKRSHICKFSYKCDVCYIGHTLQRLDIQINQYTPSNICTNTLGYTASPSNQNSSSTIAHHLLDNPICVAGNKPRMFTTLVNSNNKFLLSMLKALLIISELCIQK